MSDASNRQRGFSLRRWSERKRAAKASDPAKAQERTASPGDAGAPTAGAAVPEAPAATSVASAAAIDSAPVLPRDAEVTPATRVASPPSAAPALQHPLPPLESLTPQSDFAPFMQPGVEPSLRSAALRKLFADPRFNVMDGLDVYIDDYSKPDPIAPDVVRTLAHARYLFAPPPTRVNAQGVVEDVPAEELAAAPPDAADAHAAAGVLRAPSDADDPPEQTRLPLDTTGDNA